MPFFRLPHFPFPNNLPYSHASYYKNMHSQSCLPIKNELKSNDVTNSTTQKKSSKNNDDYFFELFGLKLYFDDVLLICLIFFLYQEGVKDEELFISLILLLLS